MADNELLQQWLDKGNNDLRSAEYLSTMQHPTPLIKSFATIASNLQKSI